MTPSERSSKQDVLDAAAIDPKVIRRWLKKARSDVFDSKAFFAKLRQAK